MIVYLVVCVLFLIIAVVVWNLAIPVSTIMVEKKILFFSPKKGSIVAKIKNNRVLGYYGNLFDEMKYVIEETGEVKSIYKLDKNEVETKEIDPIKLEEFNKQKKELADSILYRWLGVRLLGFNDLFTYQFSKDITAESIYLKNVVELEIPDLLTDEQSKVSLSAVFSLATTDAAKSLNYKDGMWMEYVKAAIKSTCRDFVGKKSYTEISSEQIEHESEKKPGEKTEKKPEEEKEKIPGLLERIRALNKSDVGNVGLPDEVGQRIVSFRLEKVQIDQKLVEAGEKPKKAQKEAEATNIKAEGEAKALKTSSEAEAKAIGIVGDEKNRILKASTEFVPKGRAVDIEIAKILAKAITETRMQAISFGNGGITSILSGKEKPTTKDKNAEE